MRNLLLVLGLAAAAAASSPRLLGTPRLLAFDAKRKPTKDWHSCVGRPLDDAPNKCKWLIDATTYGVEQLNHMINTPWLLSAYAVVSAAEKPVADSHQSHVLQIKVQVAPRNNCSGDASTSESTSTEDACAFDLNELATYEMLLTQANSTGRWTLVNSLQVDESSKSGPVLKALPDAASDDAEDTTPWLFSQTTLYTLLAGACVFSLLAVVVNTLRNRRDGYAAISRSHAQVHKAQVRRVDLRASNPVPRNEDKVLRHSHEQNERFAV
ncbi:hypothetical protein ACHHYP_03822 [Achlya hypogyna]|uniref:Secreted protein n=1 Tax=Achlya hypogyna TaxID=1202772 RepID=A0A1V9Z2Y4_ACHHY|nr:hypothetical protein ACHHYP_03822 [Achlya hypogyna]